MTMKTGNCLSRKLHDIVVAKCEAQFKQVLTFYFSCLKNFEDNSYLGKKNIFSNVVCNLDYLDPEFHFILFFILYEGHEIAQ